MNTTNFSLFPTLVSSTIDFLSIDQCRDIFVYLKNKQDIKHNTPHTIQGGGFSSHEGGDYSWDNARNILSDIENDVPSCNDIQSKLRDRVTDYCNQSGYKIGSSLHSWFNIQDAGSRLTRHIHPHAVVSGALYINTDEKSTPLYFYNPNEMTRHVQVNKETDYTYDYYRFLPKQGQLLLFPGWLYHGSNEDVNGTTDRMVISFNNF